MFIYIYIYISIFSQVLVLCFFSTYLKFGKNRVVNTQPRFVFILLDHMKDTTATLQGNPRYSFLISLDRYFLFFMFVKVKQLLLWCFYYYSLFYSFFEVYSWPWSINVACAHLAKNDVTHIRSLLTGSLKWICYIDNN